MKYITPVLLLLFVAATALAGPVVTESTEGLFSLDVLGFYGESWIDVADFIKLVSRLGINLLFTTFIVLAVYIPKHGKTEYVFTFFLFNLITFTVCFLLRKINIELGFALGLFAVFGILRYRTEPIRTRDLTYMFVVIGLAILNALVNKKVSIAELLAVNLAIAGMTAIQEYLPWLRRDRTQLVTYDNLDLVRQSDPGPLIADLKTRTGLPVYRVQIECFDLLRDTAQLTIYYSDS
jgi:hypothetical protein